MNPVVTTMSHLPLETETKACLRLPGDPCPTTMRGIRVRPNDVTDLSETVSTDSVQTPDHVSMHVMRQLLQGETGGKLELHHLTGAAEILGSVVCAVQSQNLKTK